MPRANRFFSPGHVWHITHRCHRQDFLLKFAHDRRRWRYWLFEARKRFGLTVLNYIVTSNHIHLLVRDQGRGEIATAMQLVAGRTAQEYNHRKQRRGAYWEDRYHATAVDTDGYLARCMVYIDLNMVRAGVVRHPADWDVCGYRELQNPPERYRILDLDALVDLFGTSSLAELQQDHAVWVEEALKAKSLQREAGWSESLAVGSHQFVERFQADGNVVTRYRKIMPDGDHYRLREPNVAYNRDSYGKMDSLTAENTVVLDNFH